MIKNPQQSVAGGLFHCNINLIYCRFWPGGLGFGLVVWGDVDDHAEFAVLGLADKLDAVGKLAQGVVSDWVGLGGFATGGGGLEVSVGGR